MTSYNFGDVVLLPFPFTDQRGSKKRPALIVSSAPYNAARLDLIVMAVTSQMRPAMTFGEVTINEWQKAGLLKPSIIKPVLATIEKSLVLRKLGRLEQSDLHGLQQSLRTVIC